MTRRENFEPRCRQLNLSLTEREFEDIKRRAEALGMRPVHFGRAAVLKGAVAVATPAEPIDQASRLIHLQLVRLGVNLNQLVRQLHLSGRPLPADLEPLLDDIRRLIARIP